MTPEEELSKVYQQLGYIVIARHKDCPPAKIGDIINNLQHVNLTVPWSPSSSSMVNQPVRVIAVTDFADFCEQGRILGVAKSHPYWEEIYTHFYRVDTD